MVLRRPATVTVAIYQGSTLVRTIWSGPPAHDRDVRLDVERQDGGRGLRQARHLQGRRQGDEFDRLVALRPRRHRQGALAGPPARLDFDRHDRHDRPPDRAVRRPPRTHRTRTGDGRLGRPADLQRGREPRADGGRHPRLAPGRDRPRRRRRLARRHGRPRRPPRRRRPAGPCPSPGAEAGSRPCLPRRLRGRPRRRREHRRPDGRRLQPRPGGAAEPDRADRRRRGGPRHRLPLHDGRIGSRTGASAGGSSRAAAACSPASSSASARTT